MSLGEIIGIYTAVAKGGPMQEVRVTVAETGNGLLGDRYQNGNGSWNQGAPGKRQVTLINGRFFAGSGFSFADCRRNIITKNVELMWLVGREFKIGDALFKGVSYCDPCNRPNTFTITQKSFKETFQDCGGIIAEVVRGGVIRFGDSIVPPKKSY